MWAPEEVARRLEAAASQLEDAVQLCLHGAIGYRSNWWASWDDQAKQLRKDAGKVREFRLK